MFPRELPFRTMHILVGVTNVETKENTHSLTHSPTHSAGHTKAEKIGLQLYTLILDTFLYYRDGDGKLHRGAATW